MSIEGALDWYKDAIIYQTHIKAFFDSDNDGVGDFAGLTQKLDYIKDLGVSAIWLLPFYPSPLRDDGYDIADYTNVNPSYGTLDHFKTFIETAHAQGLKVITELVINHTSDQHPWFQRARRAPRDSDERKWYVWSDDDKLYSGTRIIFTDTEKSNWTWDPVAEQYFWHRFFSHQPDLNFDHPPVMAAVIEAMYFWLDMGVDGLRLDAIPYLVERDGTSNENIPETHQVIKDLRKALDARFPDRFFLAEANMWPEDVIQYFGDDDECHMAFHFPLMPRMFMSIAREDRHPITDIMRQTPEISPNNQWAIFLRNHDELTLEMVTDKERDYLWETYAFDKRMRINVGIRRRLAPLMENDRRKIELMNSMLLSMPGTPILYYGDEIGMGDNIYLGDRDGVRTPMQWSPDRNGGYSRTDPAKLYLPAIMDPTYGFQAVNVEAQAKNSSSLLSWMKRLIAVRQGRKAFGRGKIEFLYPRNRQVLAYLRSFEDEVILCVANLSRTAQAVELDLSAFKGATPLEMIGRTRFPMVGDLPYLLTIQPYGFYWFQLEPTGAKTDMPQMAPETSQVPEYITLVVTEGPESLVHGRNKLFLDRNILPAFLPTQRWFPEKDRKLANIDTTMIGMLGDQPFHRHLLALVTEKHNGGRTPFLPADGRGMDGLPGTAAGAAAARLREGPPRPAGRAGDRRDRLAGVLQPFRRSHGFGRNHHRQGRHHPLHPHGQDARGRRSGRYHPHADRRRTEQQLGDFPQFWHVEVLSPPCHGHPARGRDRRVPDDQEGQCSVCSGYAELEFANGETSAIAILHQFVRNQGDGWDFTTKYLNRHVDHYVVLDETQAMDEPALHGDYLEFARKLGQRTGELHLALSEPTDNEAFSPEPVQTSDMQNWIAFVRDRAVTTFKRLRERAQSDDQIREVLDREADLEDAIAHLFDGVTAEGLKTRVHGDFHLARCWSTKATSPSWISRANPACRLPNAVTRHPCWSTSRACCGRSITRRGRPLNASRVTTRQNARCCKRC